MALRRVRSLTPPARLSIRFRHRGATAAVCLTAALGLAACGGGPANPAGESPRPTGGPSSSSAAEPWDLLYLSDSTGWNVAEEYQRLAAQQLGRPVRLIDARAPNRQIGDDLRWIKAHTAEVASAEIVVVWGGPVGSGVKDTLANACFTLRNPGAVTQEDWAPFGAKIGEVLDAAWAARQGRPTVLRVTDIYVPVLPDWSKAGIREECTASNEAMSAVVRQAAESHGATMVSTYDALNGTDHGDDPGTRGLISGDGVHLSHAGGVVVANALAATGFEPTTAPS
jgi:hypothetical protein